MPFNTYILADTDDAIKLVFGLIVAVVWGIGALASMAKKKQKDRESQGQHRENWQRIEQEMRERAARALSTVSQPSGQVPPPLPPPAAAYAPPPPPPPQPTFVPQRSISGGPVIQRPVQRPQVRRQVTQRPAPPTARPVAQPQPHRPKRQKQVAQVRQPPAEDVAPPVPARPLSVAPTARHDARVSADASALSRWLTPATLRSQFILTEILQPPLALRPPADLPG